MKKEKTVWEKLDDLFHPRSIAVVGASGTPNTFGFLFMDYLVKAGYKGTLYPVNPKGGEIMGFKAYPSLKDIPGDVDYVISCIVAEQVPDMIRQCPERNVKCVHLFTARMSETGDKKGQDLEMEIASEAKRLGIALLGPNCMGLYNPKEGISFAYDLPQKSGKVGGLFQSGGISINFIRYAGARGVAFSKVFSYGNAADINESDLLEYLAADSETEVIVIYIEGVRDGRRFFKTLREAAAVKPVIVLKGGKTGAGTRSTFSHTASIAGSLNAWEVVFRQCNAVQAEDMEQFVDLTVAFNSLKGITGKRVGVIGGSGGKVVLSADECDRSGLDVVPMPEDVLDFIREKTPELVNWIGNPVDFSILGGSQMLMAMELMEKMAESSGFDFLIGNMTEENPFDDFMWSQLITFEASEYRNISSKGAKPIVAVISNPDLGIENTVEWRWKNLFERRGFLTSNGVAVFSSVGRAARSLGKLADYYSNRQKFQHPETVPEPASVAKEPVIGLLKGKGRRILAEVEAKEVLKEAGIPVNETVVAGSREEAVLLSEKMGFPVVLKIVSQDILHKTESGGVELNLTGPDQVAEAFDRIMGSAVEKYPDARIEGVSVQKMIRGGTEVIIGMTKDPQFGPMLMFGLGGVWVEVLRDVSFRMVPLTRPEAGEMISEIKGRRLLGGFRGSAPVNEGVLADILVRLSDFIEKHPEIEELDINPLFAAGDRVIAADARMVLNF
ncbi:MAG: acetate--CoA ligase family protein [Bacillota bacterium]